MTTVTLTLTPELAQQLWVSASGSFLDAQPERFEHMQVLQVPFGHEFKEGTTFWCSTASDAPCGISPKPNSKPLSGLALSTYSVGEEPERRPYPCNE